MSGTAGYAGWRWYDFEGRKRSYANRGRIFIIEGAMSMVVALVAKFVLPDWPLSAKFLSTAEKELIALRLKNGNGIAKMNRLDRRALKLVTSDWKIYVGYVLYNPKSLSWALTFRKDLCYISVSLFVATQYLSSRRPFSISSDTRPRSLKCGVSPFGCLLRLSPFPPAG